jgi:hypothetical protein
MSGDLESGRFVWLMKWSNISWLVCVCTRICTFFCTKKYYQDRFVFNEMLWIVLNVITEVVTQCNHIGGCRRFGGTFCLLIGLEVNMVRQLIVIRTTSKEVEEKSFPDWWGRCAGKTALHMQEASSLETSVSAHVTIVWLFTAVETLHLFARAQLEEAASYIPEDRILNVLCIQK